jgi:hypothetical protein
VSSTVHVESTSVGFLVKTQNQGQHFVSGFASKPLGRFSPVWSQKLVARVSRFGAQN